MRIIKPSVELLVNTNNTTHVAKCARICRAGRFTSDAKDEELILTLINSEHLSMLRHGTEYFVVPGNLVEEGGSDLNTIYNDYYYSPFFAHEHDLKNNVYLFALNLQFLYENLDIDNILTPYLVTEEEFLGYNNAEFIRRFSFCCVTQISTSRELNRVSPNNIVEESTRYCNYSQDKFSNEVTICQPHWFDLFDDINCDELIYNHNTRLFEGKDKETGNDIAKVLFTAKLNKYTPKVLEKYIKSVNNQCLTYIELVTEDDVLPQDARGELVIDTATKVIYTYTYKEWKHIIDLRYYGTTGVPHPNAKIIANMIRKQLYGLGYKELHE